MNDLEIPADWLVDATNGLMTSIDQIKATLGDMADRLDEMGAQVFGDVEAKTEIYEPVLESLETVDKPTDHDTAENGDAEEDENGEIGLNSLPNEVLLRIVKAMNPPLPLLKLLSGVSKNWYLLCTNYEIWHFIFDRDIRRWYFIDGPIVENPNYLKRFGLDLKDKTNDKCQEKQTNSKWYSSSSSILNSLTSAFMVRMEEFQDVTVGRQDKDSLGKLRINEDGTWNLSSIAFAHKLPWIRRYLKLYNFNSKEHLIHADESVEEHRRRRKQSGANIPQEQDDEQLQQPLQQPQQNDIINVNDNGDDNDPAGRDRRVVEFGSIQARPILNNSTSQLKNVIYNMMLGIPTQNMLIPVFGPGVGKAQHLIYEYVAQVSPYVSIHPGNRGIGTSMGFSIQGHTLKLATVHDPPQPFHQILQTAPAWNQFFSSSDALIYAVNPTLLSIQETRNDLQDFLTLPFFATNQPQASHVSKKKPLLVICFNTAPSHSTLSIAKELGLTELTKSQPWACFSIDGLANSRDMYRSLLWILHKAHS